MMIEPPINGNNFQCTTTLNDQHRLATRNFYHKDAMQCRSPKFPRCLDKFLGGAG